MRTKRESGSTWTDMRIKAKADDGAKFKLVFPSGIFLNRVAAFVIQRLPRKKGVNLKASQIFKLMKILKKQKRKCKDFEFLEFTSNDGTNIVIQL